MTKHSPHISLRGLRRVVVATLLIAALGAVMNPAYGDRSAKATSVTFDASYCWPVAPFDRQHPVRGGFGDPRTLFRAPPTLAGLYTGPGSFSFHQGVDITAPDGTAVFPVVDGVVSSLNAGRVFVESGNRRHFEYWHIAPAVDVGQRVVAQRTVLGHILHGQAHVHLTEIDAGRVTDPLSPGHLTPYADRTIPRVASITLRRRDDASPEMPNFVRGTVYVAVEAYDTPTMRVPGIWGEMPITPALLRWHVETWNGKVVLRERTAWDTRRTLPPNSEFWRYYLRGTFQNMAVFGKHYSWLQPGCFVFRTATLDTRRLPDNVYRLVVSVADIRGNASTTSLRFSVHNDPGWVGV